MGKHKIVFVAPEDLDLSEYENILQKHLEIEYFDKEYFTNIRGYNNLMLSKEFYQRFIEYEYMLIHQLDCFVFRDELEFWCGKGYDYIGAPWLEHSYYIKSRKEKAKFLFKRFFKRLKNNLYSKDILIYKVGNGGFSLRKTKKFITILENTDANTLAPFTQSNDPRSLYNEDVFWSFISKGVKKPKYKNAAKFSLDLGADIGIRLNGGKLPFGCHAWYKKYNLWQNYIENENPPTL